MIGIYSCQLLTLPLLLDQLVYESFEIIHGYSLIDLLNYSNFPSIHEFLSLRNFSQNFSQTPKNLPSEIMRKITFI